MHAIYNGSESITGGFTLAQATERAEELSKFMEPNTTLAIRNEDDQVVRIVPNGGIPAQFIKQVWGGRKGDDAIASGEEDFDARDAVLALTYEQLMGLQDGDYSSDEIGRQYVHWNGPFEVRLVKSVLNYFGVDSLEDISEALLADTVERIKPEPIRTVKVRVAIDVVLKVRGNACADDFLSDMDYSITSDTQGVVVHGTEMVSGHIL